MRPLARCNSAATTSLPVTVSPIKRTVARLPEAGLREHQVQEVERTGRHSEKPEHFRVMIDRLYASGRRIELFRRGEVPAGWESGLDIYGLRLDASGARLGSEFAITTETADQTTPAVASDGSEFLVEWTSAHAESVDTDVQARRVDSTGTPAGAKLAIEASPALLELAPRIAFDGTHYLVASLLANPSGTQSSVAARRVTPAGVLADAQPIPLSPTAPTVENAAIASDRMGPSLVAFAGYDPAPMLQSARARAALITSLPAGAACSNAEQCASGQCTNRACTAAGGAGGRGGADPNAANLPNGRYSPGCSSAHSSAATSWLLGLLFVLVRRRWVR